MTPRWGRFVRAGRVAGGVLLLAVGLALLVLPGPGIPLLAGGLALLEPEFLWARRARRAVVAFASRAGRPLREIAPPDRPR